jgi:hypothetical protein
MHAVVSSSARAAAAVSVRRQALRGAFLGRPRLRITCVGCHDAAAAAARGAREVSRARCWTRAGTRALQVAVTWRRRLDASRLTAPRLSSERDTWRRQRHAVIKCARRPSCASARLRHAAVAQSMHKRRCASTRLEIRAAPLLLPVSEPARRAGAAQRASGWRRRAMRAAPGWLFPLWPTVLALHCRRLRVVATRQHRL